MAAVSEKAIRREIVWTGIRGKPTSIVNGGRPMTWRKKQAGALHGTAEIKPSWNAPVIAKAVSYFNPSLAAHVLVGLSIRSISAAGTNLLSVHRTPIEIELNISRHVLCGSIDRSAGRNRMFQ